MWNSHNNSTMHMHLFSRSLTTQLGFHDVLSGIFYWYLVSVLHTNCHGTGIAFFFQLKQNFPFLLSPCDTLAVNAVVSARLRKERNVSSR